MTIRFRFSLVYMIIVLCYGSFLKRGTPFLCFNSSIFQTTSMRSPIGKIEVIIRIRLLVYFFRTVLRCLHNMPYFCRLVNRFSTNIYRNEGRKPPTIDGRFSLLVC